MVRTENNGYSRLSGIGSFNSRNRVTVHTAESDDIGVAVTQPGFHKASNVEIVVPVRRSGTDSRRVATMTLSGRQARQVFETLAKHFEYDLNY